MLNTELPTINSYCLDKVTSPSFYPVNISQMKIVKNLLYTLEMISVNLTSIVGYHLVTQHGNILKAFKKEVDMWVF